MNVSILDWREAAIEEGAEAWHTGVGAQGNPYDPELNADLHNWWHHGWSVARNKELGAA